MCQLTALGNYGNADDVLNLKTKSMEKVKRPLLPLMTKQLALSLLMGGGMMLCATNATAADELARSVYNVAQTPQNQQITGRVLDAAGEPLIGVSIVEKGNKSNGTVTDIDGNFTLRVSKPTVVVSYVGYKTQEMSVAGKKTLDITLHEDAEMLSDVVVIGYGTVKKADLAGSVAIMDSKSFKDQPVARVEDALNGRMSGVQVMSSGVPGGSMKIRVRGASSVNKSNDPLYVVDGIVRETGLEGINPEDIQSIQVLKDASSTAIYGARGANGVVMVQTKMGKAGTTQVTFDASLGVSNAYHVPEAMNAQDYAKALVQYKGADANALAGYINGTNKGIDWMDQLLHTGVTQNYKVAISKGTTGTQTYFSANYMDQTGVVRDTESKRYSVKFNIHNKLFSWLELTADANLSRTENSGSAGFAQNQSNPIWVGLNYSPTMEMMDANGNYNKDPYNNIQQNPWGLVHANQSDRNRTMVTGHVDLKFNICDGLTFTTTNGIDFNDYKWYSLASKTVNGTTNMGNNNAQVMGLQSTNNLTYQHSWGDHNLTATGVWEATSRETRSMGIEGKNLAQEFVGYWNVKNAATRDASNGYSKWTMLSGVARVMYNYADRYMLTGTLRADGSSRFTNKKWGYFPSVAAAWTVSNEKFWEPMRDVVNNFKIRASYGVIGNQDIRPYSTLASLSTTGFNYGTKNTYSGYWAGGIATPDLTWEKVKQFDLGFDFGFFNNRLSLGVDLFWKNTTDALLEQSTPGYLGGQSYWTNAGEVSNKGVDVNLTAQILQKKDLQWTSTLNVSYLKNEVTKLTAQTPRLYGFSPSPGTVEASTIITEGEAIGTFYGYKWAGLEKGDDGKFYDTYYTADGKTTRTPDADKDRFVLGRSNPDVTFGWNNTINFKNWEFNAFFNAAFGAKRLNLVRYTMNTSVGASMFVTDNEYFSEVGKSMPSLDAAGNKAYGNSDKWLENANYLRCENISVAYTLPRKLTKFADVRLSVSAQNLFTITGYKGMDPAGAAFSEHNVDNNNGIDMGAYPNPRTFTFGVRLNF